jgi:phage-related protein
LELFKLFGSILIDNAEANKSISATEKKAGGLGTKLGGLIGTAAKVGVGIAAGVGAAGAAMFGMANKASEATSRINDLSEKIGITKTAFQEWDFVANQVGANVEGLQMSVKTLSKAAYEASQGVETYSDSFNELGVSVTNADGSLKDQETLLNETIAALAGVEDKTKRTAIASELLGRSATDLAPILNMGAEELEGMKTKAHELGIVLSDEAIDAGDNFGDTLDALKASVGAVGTQIGVSFMPLLQSLMDWIIAHMPEIKETFSTVFGAINTIVTKAYEIFKDNILPILISAYDWVQSNMPTFQSIFNTVFGAIWDIASDVWRIFTDNLLPILKALYEFVEPTFPIIGEIIKTAFDVIVGIVQTAVDIFDKLTSGIKTAIDWLKKWNNMDAKEKNVSGGHPVNDYDHYASGTNDARGGWSVVGEEGPELLYVPKHSKVIPNDEMNSMGGTQEITVNIPVVLEGKAVTNIVSKIQLDNTRGRARAVGVSI